MSTALDFLSQPQTLQQVSQFLRPTSFADASALVVFASAAGAYFLRGRAWDKKDPYQHLYFERPQLKEGASAHAQRQTRNIAQKLEESGKDCVIFWGSQSGTAEGLANRLAKECQQRYALATISADLSDYDAESIFQIPDTKFAIFILSTFGEGDPSDNTQGLWEWIQKSDISLNLRYAALGLGNSNYKYYNRVVDVVTEALDMFGAQKLLPVARADDADGSTGEDFITWKENLFSIFRQELNLQEQPYQYQPTLVISDGASEVDNIYDGTPKHSSDNPRLAATSSPVKPLTIKNPRELFHSKDRNCVHLELDLSEHPEVHYKTGDHLAVWPSNPDDEVDRLLTALNLHATKDSTIHIESLDTSTKAKFPSTTTVGALLRYNLEICAPLSRDAISGLVHFAPTQSAKEFVVRLSQDREYYTRFLSCTHLNLGRLLQIASPEAAWTSLPLSYVLETLPLIQPRYYSISSSSVLSPRRAAITALVSTQELSPESDGKRCQTIYGVTSNYLLAASDKAQNIPASRASQDKNVNTPVYDLAGPSGTCLTQQTSENFTSSTLKLFAHIRKSKFKLPALSSCPIIMVAAGTGLAPFRAFIAERAKMKAIGKPVGEMVLYFGCRNPEEDFIYREELDEMAKTLNGDDEKETFKVVTAFSRKQGERKVYVQDRIDEQAEEVLRLLIEGGANFYICGRASMAREVSKRVSDAAQRVKGWGDSEARQWSEGLKKRGKWKEDVWG